MAPPTTLNSSRNFPAVDAYLIPSKASPSYDAYTSDDLYFNALLRLCEFWRNIFYFFLALFGTIIIRNLNVVSKSSSALKFDPTTQRAMPPRHKGGHKEDFIGLRLLNGQVEATLTKPDAMPVVDTDGALACGTTKTDTFHSKRCVVGLVNAITPHLLAPSMLRLLPLKAALLRLCECVWLSCSHGARFINNKTTTLAGKPPRVHTSSMTISFNNFPKQQPINPLRFIARALILLLLVETASSQSIGCYTAYQCADQTSITSSGSILARGYKSNYQSSVLQASSTLYCDSSWSCARSGTAISTAGNIYAFGSYSLAFVESASALDNVMGYGYKSLLETTISLASTVYCSGLLACRYSHINVATSLTANGALSAANSVIRATATDTSFTFSGERSGYNALLFCDADQTCDIECNHNACEELFLVCSGSCNVVLSSSTTIAPIYADPSTSISGDAVDSWLDASLYKMTDTDALCELQPDEMKKDDNSVASGDVFDGSDIGDNSAFCCRGRYACNRMQFAAEHHIQVICSGTNSCDSSAIDLPSGGAMWCEAYQSCQYAVLSSIVGNVNCFGWFSCLRATIATTGNVACAGSYSCGFSEIHATSVATEDIELLFSGFRSGHKATVSIECAASSECAIRCSGYLACYQMTLSCVGDCQVHCDQDTGCPVELTSSPTASPTAYATAYPSEQLSECWGGSSNHLLNGAGGENGGAQGEKVALDTNQSSVGECDQLCKSTAGCVAYSWASSNGNVCTLWDSAVASTVYETNQIMCSVCDKPL